MSVPRSVPAAAAVLAVGLAGSPAAPQASPSIPTLPSAPSERLTEPAPDTPEGHRQDDTRIHLTIRETHHRAEAAASTARFRLRALQGALEQAPVPANPPEVGSLRLEPVMEAVLLPARPRMERETRVVGYRAVIPVTVTTPDSAALELLVQVAEGAGAELSVASEDPAEPLHVPSAPGQRDPNGAGGAP